MKDSLQGFVQLPHLIHGNIVPYLDRGTFNALSATSKSLRNFFRSNDAFFNKWPRLDVFFCEQDRREIVHLTKSPDNKKLCIVVREYNKEGYVVVCDIKQGPITKRKVNVSFQPIFSPNSKLIIVGAPGNSGRGLFIGRISTPAHTRAYLKKKREIINWTRCFSNYAIRGATFIGEKDVWVSHISGGEEPQLSSSRVYSFTVINNSNNTSGIILSDLNMSIFTVPIRNRIIENEMYVDVVHQFPYTAINVSSRWTLTSQLVICEHNKENEEYKFTYIPLSPRLNIEYGIGMNLAFSPGARSLIGVGCDRSYERSGRFVTFFDKDAGHSIDEGPYQNFTPDMHYFTEYGPPKIWYYDGNIIVYSVCMDEQYQWELNETQLTNEERNESRHEIEWDESSLSPPKAFYIRGLVPNNIKERVNRAQINMTYNVSNYFEECKLTPFLEGWSAEMWNLILNGKIYG